MTEAPQTAGRGDRIWPLYARYVQRPVLAMTPSQALLRGIFDGTVFLTGKRCADVDKTRTNLGSVPALCLTPAQPGAGRLLYLHGGSFTIGSARSHAHMVAHIAKAAGCTTWLIDYRLAPEHPFPAAPEDALAAYRALAAEGSVVVAGDSAGGCLALGLLHWTARAGLPAPRALALLSPIADLDVENNGFEDRMASELLIPASWGRRAVTAYLNGHDPKDPLASPLAAALPAAPPTLIQYAPEEALAADAQRAAQALRSAGGDVTSESYPGRPHVWQMHVGRSRAADQAVARIGAFLRSHTEAP